MKTLLALLLVLTLHAENNTKLTVGDTGATATDERDGSVSVTITGTVDTTTVGSYTLTYSASDTVGNEASVTRTVTIQPVPVTLQSLTLTVDQTFLPKETNTTLKVEASYDNNTTKDVTDTVTWLVNHPDAIQIQSHTLTAKQDTNTTLRAKLGDKTSNAVTLDIYWEVNGHRLPPEPDPAVNNATLLGVDANGNGVRDDVERWIYKTYSHPIERGIMLQDSNRLQVQIEDITKAHENSELTNKSLSCEYYLESTYDWFKQKYEYSITSKEVKKIQFNTIERHIAYQKYNAQFNGEVFEKKIVPNKENCFFDDNGNLKVQQ